MTAVIVSRRSAAGGAVVVVTGEIDLSNADRLDEAIAGCRGAAQEPVAVDLSGASYLDSAGLRVLFAHAGRGELRVYAPRGSTIATVLAITGLGEVAVLADGDGVA
jgi:anti-sigma B factor antagonist